mgnify:CR=1 FL=1|jgi:hypothetical protein
MDTTPRQFKLKSQIFLKKASWSEFIELFNQKHNPMLTSVGVVEVKVDEKKNSNSKKN